MSKDSSKTIADVTLRNVIPLFLGMQSGDFIVYLTMSTIGSEELSAKEVDRCGWTTLSSPLAIVVDNLMISIRDRNIRNFIMVPVFHHMLEIVAAL